MQVQYLDSDVSDDEQLDSYGDNELVHLLDGNDETIEIVDDVQYHFDDVQFKIILMML